MRREPQPPLLHPLEHDIGALVTAQVTGWPTARKAAKALGLTVGSGRFFGTSAFPD
jgi:hypothetical protein